MAVAKFSEWPDVSSEVVEQVSDMVNKQLGGKPPVGGIYHAEGPSEDQGWWTFDVWESESAFQSFMEYILQPALRQANAPVVTTRTLQVHWESSHAPAGN